MLNQHPSIKYSDGVVVGSVLVDSMGNCVGMNTRDTSKTKNISSMIKSYTKIKLIKD